MCTAGLVAGIAAYQQSPADPFPAPIPASEGAIAVNFIEFATIPDVAGVAPRMMTLVDEPGTQAALRQHDARIRLQRELRRQDVVAYLDVNAATWGTPVQSQRLRARRAELRVPPAVRPARHSRGYGKFYTYIDTLRT